MWERQRNTAVLLIVLVLCGILRSAIATRLDSFDLDEAYHITAGVTYVRLGDYRLNPEHPPLMKLWVGAFLTRSIFQLPKWRPLSDKYDERTFAEETVFNPNDPDAIQRRVRLAMFALNGILLFLFAWSVWRSFGNRSGPITAVGALTFLVIDPTVAAHLPVALTDLPVTLLSATAVLMAWVGFRSGRMADAVLAGVTLGLALGAKHTALIVAVVVTGVGFGILLRAREKHFRQLRQLCAVLLVAWATLWGLYRFRFNESREGTDLFNRPLSLKIADLHKPVLRNAVALMGRAHVLPRSYLWGLADILHVGIEGRITPVYFLGRTYEKRAPIYFFPTVILVKLPLALTALAVAGFVLVFGTRKREWPGREPLVVMLVLGGVLMITLAAGTTSYAGIRHGMIVYPSMALLAAAAVEIARQRRSATLMAGFVLAAVLAIVSAIPVLRPWEYYNEIVGMQNSWRYFSDEGSDSGQRLKEIAACYHSHLEPNGELPYIDYLGLEIEGRRRGIKSMQSLWKDNPEADSSNLIRGTLLVAAPSLVWYPLAYDYTPLLAVKPVDRFGCMLVYRGTYDLPALRAGRFVFRAYDSEYSAHPDLAKAAEYMSTALQVYPRVYYRWIELGNIQLRRGLRGESLQAYENARKYVPQGDEILRLLDEQIWRVRVDDLKAVPILRNPRLE